jgi:hypothetical protein
MSWITKTLGLDAWKEAIISDVAAIKAEAVDEINSAKSEAVEDISSIKLGVVKESLEPVFMDSAYIIHVPESTGIAAADRLRLAVEKLGAHCVVVAADSMRVLTLSSKT